MTNTGKSGTGGIHWILTAVKITKKGAKAIIWEPYDHERCCKHIRNSLKKACNDVSLHLTGQQKSTDGWSCGYIAVWWAVLINMQLQGNGRDDPWEEPDRPHLRWNELVWMLLKLRDQKQNALEIAMDQYLRRGLNDTEFQFVPEAIEYLQSFAV